MARPHSRIKNRIAALLILAIGCGLFAGGYLEPAHVQARASDALIDEFRMRDIPFWFSFVALGALTAMFADVTGQSMRSSLSGAMLAAYLLYAAVRILGLGDAAVYDSIGVLPLCGPLLRCAVRSPAAALRSWLVGSGSYFIYLWHIFIVMALRDHASLRQLGGFAGFASAAA